MILLRISLGSLSMWKVFLLLFVDDDTIGFTCPRPSISSLLQSATSVITKCDSLFYYKARWSVITKCGSFLNLLHSATSVITKFDDYYKTLTPTPSGREPELASPHIMESRIPGTGFQSLSEERGFWIPIVSGTLDSLSGIPESKAKDFWFHKQNFPGFRILQAKRSQIPESGFPYMERLADHLMKENYSQEEHQQQYEIGYFESNAIGCNSRGSSGRHHGRTGSQTNVFADLHSTVVKHLNGTVIVNNVRGVVVVHGTQGIQL